MGSTSTPCVRENPRPSSPGGFLSHHTLLHYALDPGALLGAPVVLGVDGVPDFDALHSRKHGEAQLYAFDILALDGEDLRNLPLSMRKTNLARLLAHHQPEGRSNASHISL